MRVVVINDGDPRPPWRELASITDPRLFRFQLPQNRGCFFCHEVTRLATPDPFFMMQDADDWAAPHRAVSLLSNLLNERSDLAISAQPQFREREDGTPYPVSVRWGRITDGHTADKFVVQKTLTEQFRYRVPQVGLIRTSCLRDIGGYHGGFRVGWDVLLTNLVLMTGTVSWTPEPLYYRLLRTESLTHSVQTGVESEYAAAVSKCLRQLYGECYAQYQLFRKALIDRDELCYYVRQICGRYVTPEDRMALEAHARNLRRLMA
jgi:hypothetical protein